jgi:mRNA interferase RelE/StbE
VSEGEFAIAWTTAARRALTRLPEKVATAVVEFLYGSLAASPHRVGKPLKLALEGLHSARRGDYRVIYRIDDEQRLVTVIAIEHRSDAYRPRSLPVAREGPMSYNGRHAQARRVFLARAAAGPGASARAASAASRPPRGAGAWVRGAGCRAWPARPRWRSGGSGPAGRRPTRDGRGPGWRLGRGGCALARPGSAR